MQIYSDKIINNSLIDISVEGFNVLMEDILYNDIYTILITFYNNSYWIKGFNLYEKNIFSTSKHTFKYINLIKSNSNYYTISFHL